MTNLSGAVEWVVKRISALTRTATDADLTDSEYMAVDNASAYTRKITVASLAAWVLGKIKSLATSITSFRTGDVIPVDGPSGTAKMSKDDLLKETTENALSSIHSVSDTATEAEISAGHYFVIDSANGKKKLPAEAVAKASEKANKEAVYSTLPSVNIYNSTQRKFVGNSGIDSTILTGSHAHFIEIPIDPSKGRIYVERVFGRSDIAFWAATTAAAPAIGSQVIDRSVFIDSSRKAFYIDPSPTANYLALMYWVDNYGGVTEQQALDGLYCSYGQKTDGVLITAVLAEEIASCDAGILDVNARVDGLIERVENIRVDGDEIEIQIPNTTGNVVENATIKFALHRGENSSVSDWQHIFSAAFDTDFSSLRFFEGTTPLPHNKVSSGNYEFVPDDGLFGPHVLHLSDNSLIACKNNKVYRSTDNTNFTELGVNGIALYVDSNDNIFTENGYKLYKSFAPSYSNVVEVLDYTATQSSIHLHAIAEDSEGNMYCGLYQAAWDVKVYRMKAGESSFSLCLTDADCQHVHSVTVDKTVTPNHIYVGVDNSATAPKCYRSVDGGDNWAEIDIPFRNRDYGYRYFGDGFALGFGEANILGGPTIYKTTDIDDANACKAVCHTLQGVRTIQKIEDTIVAFGVAGEANKIEQYMVSNDDGETWLTAYAGNLESLSHVNAGDGIRFTTDYFVPMGANEQQVIGTGYNRGYTRIYFGGNHYQALVYVNVGDIPVGGKTIKLKTGYVVDSSNESRTHSVMVVPKMTIAMNEGTGTKLNGIEVENGFTWADTNGCVRYGGLQGALEKSKHAVILNNNSMMNIGHVPINDFKFTLTMYANHDNNFTNYRGYRTTILSTANNKFRIYTAGTNLAVNVNYKELLIPVPKTLLYAKSLQFMAVSVGVNGSDLKVKIYDPDRENKFTRSFALADWDITPISAYDLWLGARTGTSSAISFAGELSFVELYEGALTAQQIREIYHGRRYFP